MPLTLCNSSTTNLLLLLQTYYYYMLVYVFPDQRGLTGSGSLHHSRETALPAPFMARVACRGLSGSHILLQSRRMRWFVVASALLVVHVRGFDVEGGAAAANAPRRPPTPGMMQPAAGQRSAVASGKARIDGVGKEFSKWYRAYQGFVAGAAKVSQLISFCCGFWLFVTSPFALLGSAFSLRLEEVGLVGFLMLYGILLVGMEIPLGAVQRILQQYFFFVYTRVGRGLFVCKVALMAWACKSVRAAPPLAIAMVIRPPPALIGTMHSLPPRLPSVARASLAHPNATLDLAPWARSCSRRLRSPSHIWPRRWGS